MAKTTRSSTAAKAQKGKVVSKAKDLKPAKSKLAAKKPVAKKAVGKAATPAKKPVAKKTVAPKPAPKKPVKSAAKPAASKAAVKKAAAKPVPKKNVAAKKPVAKPVKKAVTKKPVKAVPAKPAAKPVVAKPVVKAAKPPAPAKAAPKPAAKPESKPVAAKPAAAPVAAPVPQTAVKVSSPARTLPLHGKVASAVAMATPRHAPNKKQKAPQSSMNTATTLENGITKEDGRYALPSTTNIDLPKGYRPSNDEEYMNPKHLAYFRNKLRDWRDQLVEESRQTMENLRDEVRDVGDEAERATRETENSLELRTRDRYRKLISKIDKALRRIEEGRYGFCEETDEEIGVDRLDARPIATLSLDAQERREHLQKQMGD
jgi:DnaK suppressor protein